MNLSQGSGERSDKATILVTVGVMVAIAFAILLVSAPAEKLLGESVYSIRSAFHGLFAGVFMVTITIGVYQAFRLWSGVPLNMKELGLGSVVNSGACFLTIFSGNWLYIPYRGEGGPRGYFMEKMPEIHKIFFEFKEFGALFTFPLIVAATFIIWQYGEKLNTNKHLRTMVAILISFGFFYFAVAFGLGAAITKLKSV